MKLTLRHSALAGMLLLIPMHAATAADAHADAEALFVRRVWPLLQEKCLACHGQDEKKIKSGYDMRTREGLLRGGESEQAAVVPGKVGHSPLLLSISREHPDWEPMPPKEADRLTAQQTVWLREWIAGGAPWPDEAQAKKIATANTEKWNAEDGERVKTSGGLSPEWTDRRYQPEGLWAYRRVRKDEAGRVKDEGVHPIDALLAERMPAGLAPAPAADARTFIRRATFDLTGLPPMPEEVAAFEAESARDPQSAIRVVIDRLLASPHYGERMAQHWLDVARYADTSGFANDYERGNAWRYRDYVVRSFNADKPYDQFIREQIAGDEIDPDNPEMLIATGFLRGGPWELTAMEVAKIARQRFLDDVTNSVGETFLAHSLQCARCHDHKFDPIPTRDYYSVQAVFATTQLAERRTPFLEAENRTGFEEGRYLEARKRELTESLKSVKAKATVEAARAWFKEQGRDATDFEKAVADVAGKSPAGGEEDTALGPVRKLMQQRKVHPDLIPPPNAGFSPADYGNERVARKGLERLKWEMERYEPFAFAVYGGRTPELKSITAPQRMPADRLAKGELEKSCILTGGDPFSPGAEVKPGVLSMLDAQLPPSAFPLPASIEGRRRAFAEWVASPDNPLTTRAIVNRVWLWHFGEPIAGNPNNFGSTGKKPTHPELLDWLAATFVGNGWSFKTLHRAVMTSEAYRRSATHPGPAALAEKDPAGTSHAVFKPRRLTAEELRDTMLAVTGELNPALGGIPVRPEINLEASLQPRQVMGTFAAAWVPNPSPAQRHRRSIYALKVRGLPDPMMEVFNQPGPDFSYERREASTVTPQVFTLFNGGQTHARALALAHRALKETRSDEQAIARCFALAFSRRPTADEMQACLAHWRKIEAMIADEKPAAAKRPIEVRRDAIEENTGEKFSFQEKLHANADFVPDLQPADVPPHTRALADVCLALLNSNEFAYVY